MVVYSYENVSYISEGAFIYNIKSLKLTRPAKAFR